MKQCKKIICILFIAMIICIMFSQVYAATCSICRGTGKFPGSSSGRMEPCSSCNGSGIVETTGDIDTGYYEPGKLEEEDYEIAFSMAGTIINAITTVGIVVSVTMVIALGIRYMLGSVEERADYKKTMIPMVVGAILLFASSTIVSIIYQLMQNFKV